MFIYIYTKTYSNYDQLHQLSSTVAPPPLWHSLERMGCARVDGSARLTVHRSRSNLRRSARGLVDG